MLVLPISAVIAKMGSPFSEISMNQKKFHGKQHTF